MKLVSKLEAYKQLMSQRGIDWTTAAPPLWQVFWSLGVALPPPLFMGFIPLFLLSGTSFGLLFGTGAWFLGHLGLLDMSLEQAAVVALLTGLIVGSVVGWLMWRRSRKQALGSWSSFPPSELGT